jgi:hypothetical protein
MQIVSVHTDNEKAPVSGQALYIVVEQAKHRVKLLHPTTLSQFEIPAQDYAAGFKGELWPTPTVAVPQRNGPINEVLAQIMELRGQFCSKNQKQFPAQLVRRAIAVLTGQRVEEVAEFKESQSASGSSGPRGFAVRSEKRPGVVDAIANMLYSRKGVTLDEAVAELAKQFPDRKADGMRVTVRCQLNRLPKKLNVALLTKEVPKRGKVFQFDQTKK